MVAKSKVPTWKNSLRKSGGIVATKPLYSTIPQTYEAALQAGFSPTAAITATEIALAETGGTLNPVDKGDVNLSENGEFSYGVMQINFRPSRDGTDPIRNPALNPSLGTLLGSMQAAYKISNGGKNWHPWTTYNTGAYQKFASQVRNAISSISGGVSTPNTTLNSSSGGTSTGNSLNSILSTIGSAFQPGVLQGNLQGTNLGLTSTEAADPACSQCSYNNIPACLQCLQVEGTYAFKHVGVNIALFLLILLGVYLLFTPQVKAATNFVVNTGKKAGKAAVVAA